jgi:hypothetical protein
VWVRFAHFDSIGRRIELIQWLGFEYHGLFLQQLIPVYHNRHLAQVEWVLRLRGGRKKFERIGGFLVEAVSRWQSRPEWWIMRQEEPCRRWIIHLDWDCVTKQHCDSHLELALVEKCV